jgi:hypothetical protein
MNEEARVAGLLDLTKQHMQRFRELEDIKWRINFSVWAFFGGLAYLWVNGHLVPPDWLRKPYALLVPVFATILHGRAAVKISKQGAEHAKICYDLRRRVVAELLNIDPEKIYPVPRVVLGLRWRSWEWLGWEVLVTLILAMIVILLIWDTGVAPAPITK